MAANDQAGVPVPETEMLDSFSLDNDDFSDDLDMDVTDLPLLAEQPGKRTTPKKKVSAKECVDLSAVQHLILLLSSLIC